MRRCRRRGREFIFSRTCLYLYLANMLRLWNVFKAFTALRSFEVGTLKTLLHISMCRPYLFGSRNVLHDSSSHSPTCNITQTFGWIFFFGILHYIKSHILLHLTCLFTLICKKVY